MDSLIVEITSKYGCNKVIFEVFDLIKQTKAELPERIQPLMQETYYLISSDIFPQRIGNVQQSIKGDGIMLYPKYHN